MAVIEMSPNATSIRFDARAPDRWPRPPECLDRERKTAPLTLEPNGLKAGMER